MRCKLDDDDRDWLSIESCGSERLSSASVEGTAEEMLAIAKAIETGESVSFGRCAAERVNDGYEFYSPRNSAMGTEGLVSTEEALELAADIREKLKDYKPEPEAEAEPEEPITQPAAYHATVNFKVHLSHQVLCLDARDTDSTIDSKIVAQAVATAVEALTGPAAGELPHLRLYLHGCMVTADIDECQWLETVTNEFKQEPARRGNETMNMRCPDCGRFNPRGTRTERRLNGDSTCGVCGTKNPTAKWQAGVMPSPTSSPRAYMVALAVNLKADGGRKMTQGECKNLELAESILREKEDIKAEPSPFDNMTRIELVKQCETLSVQLTDVLNEAKSRAEEANVELSELQESTVEHRSRLEALDKKLQAMADGCETAWGIIANAGNWHGSNTSEWVGAAIRWRDEFYHPMLDMLLKPKGVVEPKGTTSTMADVLRAPAVREAMEQKFMSPLMTSNAGPDVPTPPASNDTGMVTLSYSVSVEQAEKMDSGEGDYREIERLAASQALLRKGKPAGPIGHSDGEEWVPRWVAIHLWKLLDDIDTYSDMFKDNYERLAKAVYRRQRLRFQVGTSDGYDVEFNGYRDPPREVRDCGTLKGLRHLTAAAAAYIKERKVDHHFAEIFLDSLTDYPEVLALTQPPSVPNCPPCPGEWEDLADAALNGRICEEELFSMGFSRWNEKGDEAEGDDPFTGGTLWLMPVNWYDELPKDCNFITINGEECRVDGLSKDSRMGYLAFGIVWFEKPAG